MNRSVRDLLIEGVKNPTDIPQFCRRKKGELALTLENRGTLSHRQRIEELLTEEEFLLIIFDACRYDYFEDCYPEFYSGELHRTYTTNTYTMQYLSSTWRDEHDVTYVAGGPVISDRRFELSNLDYKPSDHFDEIIDVWDSGYELELGVVPPEAVTHAAMERDSSRMVVHYFQPHAPYIGDVRLREYDAGSPSDRESKIETMKDSTRDVYDKIEAGEIGEGALKNAYRANLERVMSAAKPLVDSTSRRTVITSDHGELLGEDGRYMHGGLPHAVLSELPWLEVDNIVGEPKAIDISVSESDQDMEDQLRALGYL